MKQKYLFFMIFILALSFFYSGKVQAQWIKQNITTPENLSDVIMLDSIKAIALGDRNGILRTTNAGVTWINETIMLSAVFHWNAISFSDSLNGTIVGDYAVWETTNGGISWNHHNVPSSHKNLSVLQIDPRNIYAGDDSGYVHHSIDSGKNWSSEKLSVLPVHSIYLFKANPEIFTEYEKLIFALTPNSLFVKSLNDTSSWKNWGTLGYFNGLGSEAFRGGFSKDGTEFIVGVEGDLYSAATIIRLHPMDSHWYSVGPKSEIGELRGLSIPLVNVIYTCGANGKILKSTNGGDNWDLSNTPTNRKLNSIYFFNNKRGFAVGDSGTILYTENGGIRNEQSGQLIPYGLQDKIITCLAVEQSDYNSSIPTSNLIFAGTSENGVFQKTTTSIIDDKVADWIPLGLEGKSVTALTVQRWGVGPIDGLILFAALLPDNKQNDSTMLLSREVYLSIDTNWIKSDSGIDNNVKGIYSLNSFYYTGQTSPQPVIAGTNSGIYTRAFNVWSKSEIKGVNSQPVIVSIDVTPHWLLLQSGIAWATGYIGEATEAILVALSSTDRGMTWKSFTLNNFEGASANSVTINTRNPDSVYVAWNNNIYLTPDNGNSWETVFSSRGIFINALAVDPLYPQNIFAGGWFFDDSHQSPNHGVFLHSINRGKDWNEPDLATDKTLKEITSIIVMRKPNDNNSYIFIGTNGTGVWAYRYSVITDIEKNENFPKHFTLSQNYPNPFNPTTTIKYELPEDSKVLLSIYNILGEKVAELINSFQKAGIYKVVWNAKDFASGVYIYQIKTGKFISSKKLILLK